MILLLTALGAHAASLDLIEVGGMWGTPGATDATALWWNPAGLAVDDTTTFVAEGAPVLAAVGWDRPNPDYGIIDRDADGNADAETYDYSGRQDLTFLGVVPYLGVHSNFGVPNLGVGLGLAVPYARGGDSEPLQSIGNQNIKTGNITTLYAMLGLAYDIEDKVSLGVTGVFLDNTWDVSVDTESVTSLRDSVAEIVDDPVYWQDADTENTGYATNLDFQSLKDTAFTFNVGANVHPTDKWSVAVSYNHGAKLVNTGDVKFTFACPPEQDGGGRFGSALFGLCNPATEAVAAFDGTAEIAYQLPGRVQLGVVVNPVKKVRLELMGAYVMWSAFTDYDITTKLTSEAVLEGQAEGLTLTRDAAQNAAELVSQNRFWARDNTNTFWTGVDGKFQVHRLVLAGARVMYDHSAIPTTVLSTNNFDANSVELAGLVAFKPVKSLDIGLSYGHHFLITRTVTDSVLALDINPEERNEDRTFWPNANGTYSGGIDRFGISVRGRFGVEED